MPNGPAQQLAPWYTPDWSRRPPGMTWEDWQPWQHFMARHGREWENFAYNVRLYKGDPDPPIADPEQDRLWREQTALRIDAVGYRAGRYTIFEARRFAGWSAIGQLQGYRTLWLLQFPDLELEALRLITETCDAAIRATGALHGIDTWCIA